METPDEIKKRLEYCLGSGDCGGCIYHKGCNQLYRTRILIDSRDCIEQLEAQVPKWISVEERLPEAYSTVLVAYKDAYGETNVGAGILCNYADWVGLGFAMARDAVTHWMPLPEPPKEDGHAD